MDQLNFLSASPVSNNMSSDSHIHESEPARRTESITKAEGAFRTISEVAEELGVPTHVLRFWESKFPQVKPQRLRGGRRYYRPSDVEVLRKIKVLLYSQGYTIKGARKHVKDKGHEIHDAAQQVAAVAEKTVKVAAKKAPAPVVEAPVAAKKKDQPTLKALLGELYELKQQLAKFAVA